ncbi:MAG: VCBS repeat-containing protein [Pseudomonadota bacterium]
MNKRNMTAMLAAVLTIAGCGGGGGGTPSAQLPVAPVTPATPAPTVTLTISQPKVTLGSSATLTWSSTNATSCTASGAWAGTQAISGTSAQTPTTSGAPTYTLTCTGAGGTANQSVALTVPITVQKSSYENKAVAAEAIGAQKLPGEVAMGNAVAFADFFQDGSYSMVTHSLEYNPQDSSTVTKLGHIHFWKSVGGIWVDNTEKLLANSTGCLHPRKASVADFNGDGRPDVFFACHGFDATPFPGESPVVLLSQPDGTYKSTVVPVTCFCHSASAADVDGDGYPDVVVTGDMAASQPFFLMNKKDGTFSKDLTRLPASTKFKPIFTAELIDFSKAGKYDIFFGGHEQEASSSWPATILPNDGAGRFASTTSIVLPSAPGFGFPTDIVYKAGSIYLARTIDLQSNFYRGAAIQKIAYPSLANLTIYQHFTSYPSGTLWINWIIANGGNITALDSGYGITLPQ